MTAKRIGELSNKYANYEIFEIDPKTYRVLFNGYRDDIDPLRKDFTPTIFDKFNPNHQSICFAFYYISLPFVYICCFLIFNPISLFIHRFM